MIVLMVMEGKEIIILMMLVETEMRSLETCQMSILCKICEWLA